MNNKVMIICSDMNVRNINGKLQLDLFDCDLSSITIFDGNKYFEKSENRFEKIIKNNDFTAAEKDEMYVIDFGFSDRAKNALLKAKIYTISNLCSYSKADLSCIRDLGQTSLTDIIKKLTANGFKLSTKNKIK